MRTELWDQDPVINGGTYCLYKDKFFVVSPIKLRGYDLNTEDARPQYGKASSSATVAVAAGTWAQAHMDVGNDFISLNVFFSDADVYNLVYTSTDYIRWDSTYTV